MTSIILGIFNGGYFNDVRSKTESSCYPFEEIIGDDWMDADGIVSTVLNAGIRAERINFCIDKIEPNIQQDSSSYTCQELITLLSAPAVSNNKIIFWEYGEIVSDEYVYSKLSLPKELFN